MKIGELARQSGFSAHTLRYYEKIGLLPRVGRASGQRDYGPDSLIWLAFVGRLKSTGMPLKEMVAYARLRAQGAATLDQRRVLLAAHRARVRKHARLLQECLSVLDRKISGYAAEQKRHTGNAKQKHRTVSARAGAPHRG